jgi:mannose/fructose-specific phosphotransferase system component IIA
MAGRRTGQPILVHTPTDVVKAGTNNDRLARPSISLPLVVELVNARTSESQTRQMANSSSECGGNRRRKVEEMTV